MSDLKPHPLDEILSEKEVYEHYGKLLADKELREARQTGTIEWYDLRKGPHYTRDQIMQYLKLKERSACLNENLNQPAPSPQNEKPPASSNSTNSGSPRKTGSGTVIGMNPALERLAAAQLDAGT